MDGAGRDGGGHRTVAAVFHERGAVERAVAELAAAGFAPADVAIARREERDAVGRPSPTGDAVLTVAASDRIAEALAILDRNGAETEPKAIGHRAEIAPPEPREAVEAER